MRKNAVSPLSAREKDFCRFYVSLRNPKEAAIASGFSVFPEGKAAALLEQPNVLREIERLTKIKKPAGQIRAGLARLAFGSISDAVSLAYCDLPPDNLDKLDLFCVSEIKRPKGGGVEIKFFDRLKALERLAELSPDGDDSVNPLLRAIENSAAGSFAESDFDV